MLKHFYNSPLKASDFNKIIREIFDTYHENNTPHLERKHIDLMFSKCLNEHIKEYFSDVIDKGKLVDLPENALGPFAKKQDKELKVPDFGFNLQALFEKKIIVGLNKKSAAFKAGLREGPKVKWSNLTLARADLEATLVVETEDKIGEKEIRFQPENVKRIIPQYIFKDF